MDTPATGRAPQFRIYWAAHILLLLILALVIGWGIVSDFGAQKRADTRLLLTETELAAGMLKNCLSDIDALLAAVEKAVAVVPREKLGEYLDLLARSRRHVLSIAVSDTHGRTSTASTDVPADAAVFTRAGSARAPFSVSIVLAPEFWAQRLAPVYPAQKDMDVAVVTAGGRSVLPFAHNSRALTDRLVAAARDLNADAALSRSFSLNGDTYTLALRRVKAPLLEGGPLVVGLIPARGQVRGGLQAIPLAQALTWLTVALISTLALAAELRARRRAEEKVVTVSSDKAARENFIKVILDNAPVMVAYWDARQRCRYANGVYRDWFGRTEEQIIGQDARSVLGEALYAVCAPLIEATLRGEAQIFEQQRKRVDGSMGYVLSRYIPDMENGEAQGFFVIVSDVTELKETQIKLEERVDDLYAMATTDSLTGLSNRRDLLEKVQFEMELSRRLDLQVSFLMLDIDHFKRINDTFGHDAGDAVLRRLGLLLRETLRTVDHAGRLGGEEFGVLLTATGPEEAYAVAERIRKEVMELAVAHGGETMRFTISIGVSYLVAAQPLSLEEMIKKADTALYAAKNSGRNRVCMAEDEGALA